MEAIECPDGDLVGDSMGHNSPGDMSHVPRWQASHDKL